MAYTINANAKNVWIRDNEDTRDLSIQTDASSVYLDNGRTLEQELGEGSMVSNVTTVDSAMSKVIDGTLDGVYESGVMYGRSLVNILNTPTVTVTFNNGWRGLSPNRTLEIGKKYLAIYHVETNTLDGTIKDVFRYGDDQTLWGISVVPIGGVGVFKRIFTTPHEIIGYNCYTDNSTTGSANVRCVLLEYQEGMENWDIPYFEGICDVKMPILQNTGENLFDPNSPLPDNLNYFYNSDNKNQLVTHAQMLSCAIPVIKGKTYSFYFNHDEIPLKVHKSGVFPTFVSGGVGGNGYAHNVRTITAPMDGYFGIMFCYTEDGTTDNWTKVARDWKKQLKLTIVEGKSINTYIPYKTNILRTSEEIVLREVNGVCDTYNVLTGEYVKRIGEIILNGTEKWGNFRDETDTTWRTSFSLPDAKPSSVCICDKFIHSKGATEEKVKVYITTTPNLSITVLKSEFPTLEAFKTWLSQNPVTIQYELAEPVTSIVKPSTMTPFTYQNGHVILESGFEGQSLLPTLEYSTVVNRTGQVESVAKTIRTQEKQLTMLEQMLIQNIIGLDYNNTVLALNLEINEVM